MLALGSHRTFGPQAEDHPRCNIGIDAGGDRVGAQRKAFELAGYPNEEVEARFGGMLNAFRYGAPPHGGIAPGVDRIVMLLAGATTIRDVIAFPLNQQARDLLMNAPSEVMERQLKELHLRIAPPIKV